MLVKETSKFFKSSEEVVSAFLGLVIVVVVVGLIFNFIQRQRGSISVPGISSIRQEEKKTDNITDESVTGSDTVKSLTYEVKKGDSLWKISEKIYGSGYEWKRIATANKLDKPSMLAVGTKLSIETGGQVDIKKENSGVKNFEKQKTVISEGEEYQVSKGDSLWKISVTAYGDGYRWVEVWNANKKLIANPNKIYPNTKIAIPKLSKVL